MTLQSVLQCHQALFQERLGTLQGHKVRIIADPEANPRFCKARSVQYALSDKVDDELSRLVEGRHFSISAILRMGCTNCSGVEG